MLLYSGDNGVLARSRRASLSSSSRKTLLIGGYLSSAFPHHAALSPRFCLYVFFIAAFSSFFSALARRVTNGALRAFLKKCFLSLEK
jgi:hypothetical protein